MTVSFYLWKLSQGHCCNFFWLFWGKCLCHIRPTKCSSKSTFIGHRTWFKYLDIIDHRQQEKLAWENLASGNIPCLRSVNLIHFTSLGCCYWENPATGIVLCCLWDCIRYSWHMSNLVKHCTSLATCHLLFARKFCWEMQVTHLESFFT